MDSWFPDEIPTTAHFNPLQTQVLASPQSSRQTLFPSRQAIKCTPQGSPAVPSIHVPISQDCCNSDHKLGGLLQQQKSILSVLEARSPEVKVLQGHIPSGGSRGKPISGSFQLLVAACIPWLIAASLYSLRPAFPNFSLLCLHVFSVGVEPPSAFLLEGYV